MAKIKNSTKRNYALSQIFLMVFSIIAISFMIGSSVPSVSAVDYNLKSNPSVTVSSNNPTQVQSYYKEITNTINAVNSGTMQKPDNFNSLVADQSTLYSLIISPNTNTNTNPSAPSTPPVLGSNTQASAQNDLKTGTNIIKGVAVSGITGAGKEYLNNFIKKTVKLVKPSTDVNSLVDQSWNWEMESIKALEKSEFQSGFSKLMSSLFSKGNAFKSFGGENGVKGIGNVFARLGAYALVATAAKYAAQLVARSLGASVDQSKVIGNTAFIATFATLAGHGLLGLSAVSAGAIALPIAAIYFLYAYKREAGDVVKYQCLPYTAPSAQNSDCSACNTGVFPCTEYQCKSLGQNCKLFAENGKELCVASDRNDVTPPVISPLQSALPDGFTYVNLKTNFPEDRGVKVINNNNQKGCVQPFQDVSFGINLNEPGICKYDFNRTKNYDEMQNQFFSNGQPIINSSLHLTFPDAQSMNDSGLSYSGLFNQVYVRCKDAAGNKDTANFVFQFCVDPAPDISPPVILEADPLNGTSMAFNSTSVDSTFYVNKPSECKWSNQNIAFKDMTNNMSCATSIEQGVTTKNTIAYPCKTTLTGLINYQKNDFYVSCKSFPGRNESERATMTNAYKYELTLTRPLEIKSITPNETTIKSSAEIIPITITVNTLSGADNGNAYCKYKINNQSNPIMMYDTGTATSTQQLSLAAGTYNLEVMCYDVAGNSETKDTTFTVESDTTPPIVTRAYYDENNLKILTNENSSCVYSTDSCSYQFEDGIKLESTSETSHYTPWDTNSNLYIKCRDSFGNEPAPGECSIVVKAYDSTKTN